MSKVAEDRTELRGQRVAPVQSRIDWVDEIEPRSGRLDLGTGRESILPHQILR